MKINQKYLLLTLSGLLIMGVVFSIVQVTKAGVTGPHNPGHLWANIDKPADCPIVGQYVYGANDAGWLCNTPAGGIVCSDCDASFVNEGQASSITTGMITDGTIVNADIGNMDWTKLQSYPVACAANQFVTAVGDTLTCAGAPAIACASCDASFVNEGQASSITTGMITDGTIVNADIGNMDWTKLQSYPTCPIAGQFITGLGDTLTCAAGTTLPAGANGNTLRNNAGTWVADNSIYNDGTNVGIDTQSPSFKLQVRGDVGPDANNTYNLGSAALRWNKLYVQTIDPVYEIDGQKYATYVSDFAGGVRVDTSGIIKLSPDYTINFDNLEKGTDFWLFWETSNKNINDLAVILTPGFDGRAWYQKEGNKLIVYGDKAGEISYRLTLPREDYKDWQNEIIQ